MLQRVLYVSRAAAGIDLTKVFEVIRASHALNTARGLSGALLFLDGWFAQIVEGPAASVDAAFNCIAADARHFDVGLRIRSRALGRVFPGQAMALRHRGCVDAGVLDEFGYRPGFPVAEFPADILTEMMIRTCRTREMCRTGTP